MTDVAASRESGKGATEVSPAEPDVDIPHRGRLHEIDPGAPFGLARGQCVVCIPVFDGYKLFAECLRSVLQHTPSHVPIVVADDAGDDSAVLELLRTLDRDGHLGLTVFYLRQPRNLGFVENVNSVFDAAEPADVIVLNSDCVVAKWWFEGMRDAANSDGTVATASALSNHGTILSVPHRDHPVPDLPQQWSLDEAAAAVRAASPRLRPRLPTAIGHCMYIRRSALELVGSFDPAFSPGYEEEVDFSQRCIQRGLCHVAADDVLVLHHGSGSFGSGAAVEELRARHHRLITSRYPSYEAAVAQAATDESTPLARSLSSARRALTGLSVTVDATCIRSPHLQGTQVHALELIHALWRNGGVRLRVAVSERCSAAALSLIEKLDGVDIIVWEEVDNASPRTDVVHRPYQVNRAEELVTLGRLGERLVATQQDLIAYRNPSYFADAKAWKAYMETARTTLGLADSVLFFCRHAADDAIAEGLVPAERAHVVKLGTDRHVLLDAATPRRPAALAAADSSLLVCLGADFHHKNRVFALAVVDSLQRRHGWKGRLVLVGPKVEHGSSAADEAEFLVSHPEVDRATVRLAAATEAERLWLMQHADAMLYPTVHEGFGLIPFEAAELGVPCLFASQTALAELLPASAATIVPWDAAATADAALRVLSDACARSALVEAVRLAGVTLTWDQTATRVIDAYSAAADAAPRLVNGLDLMRSPITGLGHQLVGGGGVLKEPVQEALWAVARRRSVGRPLFGTIVGIHRLGHAVTRRRRRSADD